MCGCTTAGSRMRPVLLGELLIGRAQSNSVAGLFRGEVVVDVGQLGRRAVWPSVVARLGDRRPLAMTGRPTGGIGRVGVRRVVSDVQRIGRRVDLDPERVAQPHRVDLRAGVGRVATEQVSGRDPVAATRLRPDP